MSQGLIQGGGGGGGGMMNYKTCKYLRCNCNLQGLINILLKNY